MKNFDFEISCNEIENISPCDYGDNVSLKLKNVSPFTIINKLILYFSSITEMGIVDKLLETKNKMLLEAKEQKWTYEIDNTGFNN